MKTLLTTLLLCLLLPLHAGAQTTSGAGALTDAIVQGLGVTNSQAEGGLGSLFSLAQSTLGNEQFAGLADAVPGMDTLLEAAPAVEGASKSLGGFSSALGNYGEALKGANQVYSQFKTLGLDAAAIPQYVDITNSYLQSNGGQSAVDLFSIGIAALL